MPLESYSFADVKNELKTILIRIGKIRAGITLCLKSGGHTHLLLVSVICTVAFFWWFSVFFLLFFFGGGGGLLCTQMTFKARSCVIQIFI